MISGGINDDRQQTAAADEEQAAAAARSHHAAVVASSSRQWSAQTESRIVRVSRVFGGKDRHSKVKTVKGLRDRRVRLSVPTAIQLYDLQDRLGLNQPSKVVDWLLNAARHEIDKLPPLQFPPHQQDLMVSHHHHLPPSQMIPLAVHEEKFGGHFAAALAASERAKKAEADAADGSGPAAQHLGRLIPGGYHRFMGLNNSLGMVNSGATMAYSNHSYAGGEAWNNNSNVHHDSGAGSPHVAAAAAAQHSSFPSLLSLAPGPHHHQLVFYSSEADQQFQQELGSQGLSLSSVRAFHDQTGS
ncbi:hypothetical protein PR202_ga09567 [Eleusine coracana subsp. coracana]|uniref:TCP domain-containing protein n=1 Tax=Eleusine coracana subsp. coracana TaxID=191504 RepID=A0AAV5C544_ELECO|nr:hypothetical protein QOZ80_1AG0034180 [Eleusine coracana subsp. coracana]GJM93048.1 hypothetical protein PR202_ga09567 [Eleusine coracana subsp. coracana]